MRHYCPTQHNWTIRLAFASVVCLALACTTRYSGSDAGEEEKEDDVSLIQSLSPEGMLFRQECNILGQNFDIIGDTESCWRACSGEVVHLAGFTDGYWFKDGKKNLCCCQNTSAFEVSCTANGGHYARTSTPQTCDGRCESGFVTLSDFEDTDRVDFGGGEWGCCCAPIEADAEDNAGLQDVEDSQGTGGSQPAGGKPDDSRFRALCQNHSGAYETIKEPQTCENQCEGKVADLSGLGEKYWFRLGGDEWGCCCDKNATASKPDDSDFKSKCRSQNGDYKKIATPQSCEAKCDSKGVVQLSEYSEAYWLDLSGGEWGCCCATEDGGSKPDDSRFKGACRNHDGNYKRISAPQTCEAKCGSDGVVQLSEFGKDYWLHLGGSEWGCCCATNSSSSKPDDSKFKRECRNNDGDYKTIKNPEKCKTKCGGNLVQVPDFGNDHWFHLGGDEWGCCCQNGSKFQKSCRARDGDYKKIRTPQDCKGKCGSGAVVQLPDFGNNHWFDFGDGKWGCCCDQSKRFQSACENKKGNYERIYDPKTCWQHCSQEIVELSEFDGNHWLHLDKGITACCCDTRNTASKRTKFKKACDAHGGKSEEFVGSMSCWDYCYQRVVDLPEFDNRHWLALVDAKYVCCCQK